MHVIKRVASKNHFMWSAETAFTAKTGFDEKKTETFLMNLNVSKRCLLGLNS